jgi:hypothetical protein
MPHNAGKISPLSESGAANDDDDDDDDDEEDDVGVGELA